MLFSTKETQQGESNDSPSMQNKDALWVFHKFQKNVTLVLQWARPVQASRAQCDLCYPVQPASAVQSTVTQLDISNIQ